MTTKTEEALKLLAEGKTVREAARIVDISESALHSALKKSRATAVCPCCGSKVPPGQIDESVLVK